MAKDIATHEKLCIQASNDIVSYGQMGFPKCAPIHNFTCEICLIRWDTIWFIWRYKECMITNWMLLERVECAMHLRLALRTHWVASQLYNVSLERVEFTLSPRLALIAYLSSLGSLGSSKFKNTIWRL